jgi:hypothetical protein
MSSASPHRARSSSWKTTASCESLPLREIDAHGSTLLAAESLRAVETALELGIGSRAGFGRSTVVTRRIGSSFFFVPQSLGGLRGRRRDRRVDGVSELGQPMNDFGGLPLWLKVPVSGWAVGSISSSSLNGGTSMAPLCERRHRGGHRGGRDLMVTAFSS